MLQNHHRIGNFTSSEIFRLLGTNKREMTEAELAARPKKGKGSSATLVEDNSVLSKDAMEYIAECNWERRLGRAIENETSARQLSWGKICEKYVLEVLLGTEYVPCSTTTIVHPDYEWWSGSPDSKKYSPEFDTVADCKAPFTLKSFCQLVEPLLKGFMGIEAMEKIVSGHKDGKKFRAQLVSNACICNVPYAELIIFCPYREELEAIRELARNIDDPMEQRNYYWINMAGDDELPYLIKGNGYDHLNIVRFEVPESDKRTMTEKVKMAKDFLIEKEIKTQI